MIEMEQHLVLPLPTLAPRCIRAFQAHRIDSVAAGLPMPEGFTSYQLQCTCSHSIWRVIGNWFEDTTEFVGPLFAECVNCGTRLRIIDTAVDGHNGEIGDGITEDETAETVWSCRECQAPEGSLITSFGYQYEPDEEAAKRLQDYFDCFILTHVCVNSRTTVQVTMFDCA